MFKSLLAALLLTGAAHAAEPDASSERAIGPMPTLEQIQDTNDRWSGVGIGYDNGLWGSRFAQGLKVSLPFGSGRVGRHLGLRLRGTFIHDDTGDRFTPVLAGGAELFGRSPVFLGVLRTYGGGGFWYGDTFGRDDSVASVAGGGHYGVEVIASPRTSFTFEVGGQSPLHPEQVDAGASVMAGTTVYLGRVRRNR